MNPLPQEAELQNKVLEIQRSQQVCTRKMTGELCETCEAIVQKHNTQIMQLLTDYARKEQEAEALLWSKEEATVDHAAFHKWARQRIAALSNPPVEEDKQ